MPHAPCWRRCTRQKGAVVNIIGLAGESYNYDYVTGTMGTPADGLHPRRGLQERHHGVRVVRSTRRPPAPTACSLCCAAKPSSNGAIPSVGRAHQAHAVRQGGGADEWPILRYSWPRTARLH